MGKLSQKELIEEGFGDAIRAAARATVSGAAKAAGGAVGGLAGAALGVAKNVGKSIITGDASANPLKDISSGITSGGIKGAKIGAAAGTAALTRIVGKEEVALRKELETNYKDVFQSISIEIFRGQPDPTNSNIIIIPFVARRIGAPTILTPDPNVATGHTLLQNKFIAGLVNRAFGTTLQGQSKSATTGLSGADYELTGRFALPVTQYFEDLAKSQRGLFFGYVKKTGDKQRPYEITIRDVNGTLISGTGETKGQKPKLDVLLRTIPHFNPRDSKIVNWVNALKSVLPSSAKDDISRDALNTLIPAASGHDDYKLTADDVNKLREYLKSKYIISEKYSQLDVVLQLKLLNNSYNKVYELPKYKNN